MKNSKLLITLTAILTSALLFSCAPKKADSETTAPETTPENGMVYEYSEGGNSDRIVSGTSYKNGKVEYINKYEYWDDGRLMSVTTTDANGKVTSSWHYNYFENGVLSQMVRVYNADGFEHKDNYSYNDNGTLASIMYYAEEMLINGNRYSYNEDGKRTREERVGSDGKVIDYTEYELNKEGRTVSSRYYTFDSEAEHSLYEYNDKGKLVLITTYSSLSDAVVRKSILEYGTDGKLTRTVMQDSEGNTTGYTEHIYDDDGNNVRDIVYEDGKPVYRYDYTKEGAAIYTPYN